MLSRVITSWGGMSSATTRSETFCILANKGGRKISPGPLAPPERPRKKSTPRSYSRSTRSPLNRYSTTPAIVAITISISSSSRAEGFDDDGRPLAAADARRAQAEARSPLAPPQGVEQVDRDPCAGRGERGADRDRAAVHVGPGAGEAELLL